MESGVKPAELAWCGMRMKPRMEGRDSYLPKVKNGSEGRPDPPADVTG